MDNKILYTAHKSIWSHSSAIVASIILGIIGVILIVIGATSEIFLLVGGIGLIVVGILVALITFLCVRKFEVRFYSDRIIVRRGIINVREDQSVITPIIGVRLNQTLWQRIFNAGDLAIDKVGKGWDLDLTWIHDPKALKRYLESLINSTDYSSMGKFVSQ